MLRVDNSNIKGAGKGLFATEDIQTDDRIAEFIGEVLKPEEVEDLDDKQKYYLVDLDGYYTLYSQDCPAAFANDAEGFVDTGYENNSVIEIDDEYKVYLVATKDIKAGDEIFVSYGEEYWKIYRYNHSLDDQEEYEEEIRERNGTNILTKFKLFEHEYIHKMTFDKDGKSNIIWKDDLEEVQDLKLRLKNIESFRDFLKSKPYQPGVGHTMMRLDSDYRECLAKLDELKAKGIDIEDNDEFSNPLDTEPENISRSMRPGPR